MPSYKPVLLMILDGWGVREMEHGNAVLLAKTPNYDRWQRTLERSLLGASGESVGLVPDQMGNSEVGHLNLGAGRILYQDITRIDKDIKDMVFYQNETLIAAFNRAKTQNGKLHVIGLLGSGGVHSHDSHLYALLRLAEQEKIQTVVHVITDGRDTSPGSAEGFLKKLQAYLDVHGGTIATVSGRYYAMDRDKRWERTNRAYHAIVFHESQSVANTALDAVTHSYLNKVTDEFIEPTIISTTQNVLVEPGDCVVFYNFRADRMRQIVRLFVEENPAERHGTERINGLDVITYTQYEEDLPVKVLFPIEIVKNPLAEVLSKAGKKQFHIAETEKYPHVTFFFNGRREEPYEGEDRIIVPSPKVATYDLQPEMSAPEVTETILKRLREHEDDFLLLNFANPDMVGHTGILEAAIKAIETVDECAGRVVDAVLQKGGVAIVTADHGNSERMINEVTGEPHTYHTTSAVPLFVIGNHYFGLRPQGILADVAPTVLELLGVTQPEEMTGRSLIHFDL